MAITSVDIPMLAKAVKKLLKPEELPTFTLKENEKGNLDVYLNNKVYEVTEKRVVYTRRTSSWDVLAPGVVEQLRSSGLIFPKAEESNSSPIDIPKAINLVLLDILGQAGLINLIPPMEERQDAVNQYNAQNLKMIRVILNELKVDVTPNIKEVPKSIDNHGLGHRGPGVTGVLPPKVLPEQEEFLSLE